jgi:hypothetical protein
VASKADESNPVKTPTIEPNSRHSDADNHRKLVAVADNLSTYSPKVGVPFHSQDTSFCFPSRTRLKLRGRHDRRMMDVLLTNQITRAVIC